MIIEEADVELSRTRGQPPQQNPAARARTTSEYVRDVDAERRESLRTMRGLLIGGGLCLMLWAGALGALVLFLAR